MSKPHLLYLIHRIPFPPDKGDKIRSYHFLKYLSKHYIIHLGTFVDDPNDTQYIPRLEQYCDTFNVISLNPLKSKIKSLSGLLTGQALTLSYYNSPAMQQWVDKVVTNFKIDSILVFSSAMAQFVENFESFYRLVDFVDIDSDKWIQYSNNKIWPLSWLYQREGIFLRRYENKIAGEFDASCFVSKYESEMFKTHLKIGKDKIHFINNGVDYNYFSPDHAYVSPYETASKKLVFVGAMDYWPNIDAAIWFSQTIFPKIVRIVSNVELYIVGSNPTDEILALGTTKGITVTGRVQDVRPYMAYSDIIIAPLRIARGVQNKVLEAMSMKKPILATELALEGIEHDNTIIGFSVNELEQMVKHVVDSFDNDAIEQNSLNIIKNHYDWEINTEKLQQLLR